MRLDIINKNIHMLPVIREYDEIGEVKSVVKNGES